MTSQLLRLFIAIELPGEVKQALAELQNRLQRDLPPKVVRWVRPGAMHLSLRFLGDTPSERVDAVIDGMKSATRGFTPFSLAVAGFGCFPNPRRARVLWAGVPQVPKGLTGLHRTTDLQMAKLGWSRERRAFTPHLTLGRVNKRVSSQDLRVLEKVLSRTSAGQLGNIPVGELVLFRSQLQPGGAVYTVLARAPIFASRG
ncbi:MAG: RNA 2',3'-cyclic phosphodiesterase [Chloroflexota bacterium]|nr:RNA 2',3'-cyclic phosphodiesterase [Chloroflexota bacterium]